MLKGSIVALITPFKDENLSEGEYIKLINYHLTNGTNGVVPGGTTGESPTLSHNEHKKIIEIAVKECKGKILLLHIPFEVRPTFQLGNTSAKALLPKIYKIGKSLKKEKPQLHQHLIISIKKNSL